jgi:RimJ/RimL family protein N-acetyltransferase
MFRSAFLKAQFALLLQKYGGINSLSEEAAKWLYRNSISIGLEKNLDEPDPKIECDLKYTLKPASPQDIEEMVQKIKGEGPEAVRFLVMGKWFYDHGLRNCYVARDQHSGELCYIQWLISRKDAETGSIVFKSSYTYQRLGDYDIQYDNGYTFTNYRGKKLATAIKTNLFQIAREQGFKRVVIYVAPKNIASLVSCYRVGFKPFEQIKIKVFCLVTRRWEIPLPANTPVEYLIPAKQAT